MMSTLKARKRMLRVRKVQHDIAAGAFVRSKAELTRVETSQLRVKSLQSAMQVEVGLTSGANLARHAEMSGRLERANAQLDLLCKEARQAKDAQDLVRIAAEQAHEGAKRLMGKAVTELETLKTKRGIIRSRRRGLGTEGEASR